MNKNDKKTAAFIMFALGSQVYVVWWVCMMLFQRSVLQMCFSEEWRWKSS